MKNTDYLLPALAAVAVAILFPHLLDWANAHGIGMEGADMVAGLFINISTLDLSDVLFLVLGLLTMYVYFKLDTPVERPAQLQQFEYRNLDHHCTERHIYWHSCVGSIRHHYVSGHASKQRRATW